MAGHVKSKTRGPIQTGIFAEGSKHLPAYCLFEREKERGAGRGVVTLKRKRTT
jgi:hypothetical protein